MPSECYKEKGQTICGKTINAFRTIAVTILSIGESPAAGRGNQGQDH
jgi:hypothetical protein